MDRDIADLEFTQFDTAKFEREFSGSRGPQIPGEVAPMVWLVRWAIFERDTAWINDDSDHTFSFHAVCEALGINYQAARKILIIQRIGKGRKVPALFRQPKTLELDGQRHSGTGESLARLQRMPAWSHFEPCAEWRQRYS